MLHVSNTNGLPHLGMRVPPNVEYFRYGSPVSAAETGSVSQATCKKKISSGDWLYDKHVGPQYALSPVTQVLPVGAGTVWRGVKPILVRVRTPSQFRS
jgi:hypothetical protein